MSNIVLHSQQFTMQDVERMAIGIAKSGLFGVKTPEQALALMLVAQAEGRHPASAARDYDIIQGRPSKKAEAMLRDFLANSGKVEWHKLDDSCADATFSHPQGGSVRITWDMERAKKAGLGGKDMWAKYPRQMFRSRCVSEGVRTVFPMATSGMYVPEEENDIDRPMKNITPTDGKKSLGENPFAPPKDADTATDWKSWCAAAKAEISGMTVLQEIDTWETVNSETINRLANENRKFFDRLFAIITDQRKKVASDD